MITAIKAALRRSLLTADERTILEAPRDTVLRAMLSANEWHVLQAMRMPVLPVAEPTFAKGDAEALAQFWRSPLGLKTDAAMNNWLIQLGQAALSAPPEHIETHAKFAWGARSGWEMGKTISRLVAAHSNAETESTAGDSNLDQLNP